MSTPPELKILVTGGAGFIGSALIRYLCCHTDHSVLNLDKLTYAGHLESLADVQNDHRYKFCRGDISDTQLVSDLFNSFKPDLVMHLAAESHVDRSIDGARKFIDTNITGTYVLLEVARAYWSQLSSEKQDRFRFHYVSTDEVFGSLGETGLFSEQSPYDPSSPYSATKASSDHLVRAWHRTYGLPIIITNCSNNYGPYQYPEKLIPLMIQKALLGERLPVYGSGEQVRDWLYVEDHVYALYLAATRGRCGETYNIGGCNERTNLQVVKAVCDLLDELRPAEKGVGFSYRQLIEHVADRPGHDQRYAIDAGKIQRELGPLPIEPFESGLRKTVNWYLANQEWCHRVLGRSPKNARLGLGGVRG